MKRLSILLFVFTIILIGESLEIKAKESDFQDKYTQSLKNVMSKKDEDEYIDIVLVFDEEEIQETKDYSNVVIEGNNLRQVKNSLRIHRESLRFANKKIVDKNMKKLNESFDVKYVSKYAPLAVVSIQIKYLDKLSNVEEIVMIDLYQEVNYVDKVDTEFFDVVKTLISKNSYLNLTQIDEVKNNYGVSGEGITIGILDANGVDTTNPELTTGVALNPSDSSEHCTTVAIIAAGRLTGVAHEATIMVEDTNYLFDSIDTLISQGVNVLNMSFSLSGPQGYYDSFDMYLDYIVRNTRVSIVNSAGNRGHSDALITNGSAASNVITVGSSAAHYYGISNFSSYLAVDDLFIKPNLVAPGGQSYPSSNCGITDTCYDVHALDVPNSPMDDVDITGTSFSAPQVTGSIALMMEYDYHLISYPYTIMGLLSAGASPYFLSASPDIDSESGLAIKSGAGLMLLDKTFELIEDSSFYHYSIGNNTSNLITVKKLNFQSGDELRIVNSYLRNQLEYQANPNNWEERYDLSNLDLEIYSSSGELIVSSTTSISNVEILDFIVPETGVYTLKIRMKSNSTTTLNNLGSITIRSELGFTVYVPSSC